LSRQIRATEANEIPSSLASSRADQCVTPRCAGVASPRRFASELVASVRWWQAESQHYESTLITNDGRLSS